MVEEVQEVLGGPDHARAFLHHRDAAGAEHGTRLRDRFEVQLHVQVPGHQEGGRRAARNERLERLLAPHAARDVIDHLAERDAHRHLVVARTLHVPAHAEDPRAAALGRVPDGGEPLGPAVHDVRDVGQRFHVVDHRRFLEQAVGGGERRLDPGQAPLALQGFEQGGLLSADIGAGAAVHVQVQCEGASEDVFAEVARLVGLRQRALEDFGAEGELSTDVNIGRSDADGVGGEDHALDHLVRVSLHQLAVLERAGLALIGVADEIARAGMVLGNKRPFHAGREAGAAASPQAGLLDHLGDVGRRDLAQDLLQGLIAARTLVVGERAAVAGLRHVLEKQ